MSASRILTALFALSLMAPAAQAATVNFSGNHENMHLVAIGQTGTINTNPDTNSGYNVLDFVYGKLPAHSEITFSYQITGANATKMGQGVRPYAYGDYDVTVKHVDYYGYSVDTATGPGTGFGTSVGHIVSHHHDSLAPSLVLATADIQGVDYGTATIINNSNFVTYFESALEQLVRCFHGNLTVTYNVSAVPLPASLPMFAFALVAMGMLARRQKARS